MLLRAACAAANGKLAIVVVHHSHMRAYVRRILTEHGLEGDTRVRCLTLEDVARGRLRGLRVEACSVFADHVCFEVSPWPTGAPQEWWEAEARGLVR